MTVRITDLDAFDRLVQVEGQGYLTGGPKPGSGYAFADYKAKWLAEHEEYGPDAGYGAIYGLWGLYRYFVRWSDGEILFSRYHATAEGIARAQAAGFTVF